MNFRFVLHCFYMKYKHIIALFVTGILLWFFASWSKITHQPFAQTMVHISHAVIIISCLLAILKLLQEKKDNFLNK
jgi:hypothetical protein